MGSTQLTHVRDFGPDIQRGGLFRNHADDLYENLVIAASPVNATA